MPLTPEQVSFFNKNGYVILNDFFNSEELNNFKNDVNHVIRIALKKAGLEAASYLNKEFDEGIIALEQVNHSFVADIYDTIFQLPSFLRIVSKPEISHAVNQLLKREKTNPLYTFTCRCRIDQPFDNRKTYGWHQEVFYTIPESEFLQTWAPLIRDTTIENGTIGVCPGSHHEGIPPQTWTKIGRNASQIIVDDEIVGKYTPKSIPMKLNDLMIFHNRLFHKSGENTSHEVRYSLVGMYHNPDFSTFRVPVMDYMYKKTPEEYFDEVFENGIRPGKNKR